MKRSFQCGLPESGRMLGILAVASLLFAAAGVGALVDLFREAK